MVAPLLTRLCFHQPENMDRRLLWNSALEKRYHALKNDTRRPDLKVRYLPLKKQIECRSAGGKQFSPCRCTRTFRNFRLNFGVKMCSKRI